MTSALSNDRKQTPKHLEESPFDHDMGPPFSLSSCLGASVVIRAYKDVLGNPSAPTPPQFEIHQTHQTSIQRTYRAYLVSI